MSARVRARLALLLLMAATLRPSAAEAQNFREFGEFAGAQGSGSDGRSMAVYGFGSLPVPSLGNPQSPAFPVAWSNGGGMQPGYGWSFEPSGGATAPDMPRGVGSGGIATSSETAQATFLAMRQFTQTLLDPAVDGRGAEPAGFDAELSAYAAGGTDPTHGGVGRESYASLYGRPSLAVRRWSVWAANLGSSQVATGNAASSSRSFGTVAGADYLLSPSTRLGFALAGGGTGFANEMLSGRSDLFQAGAFARQSLGSAYVASALGYGWQAISNDYRATLAGSAAPGAAVNANAYSARVESGYRFSTTLMGVTPYAAAQITTFRLPIGAAAGGDAFTETRSEVGLRIGTSLGHADGVISLRSRLGWSHQFGTEQTGSALPQARPLQGGLRSGTMAAADAAVTGLAIELRAISGWSASANVDGEISSQTRSYTGRAALRYAW